jgi:hypothetical protein
MVFLNRLDRVRCFKAFDHKTSNEQPQQEWVLSPCVSAGRPAADRNAKTPPAFPIPRRIIPFPKQFHCFFQRLSHLRN